MDFSKTRNEVIEDHIDPEKSYNAPIKQEHDYGYESVLVNAERYGQTKRGLKSRHIQLIALGGVIGTGLFVGSGATLGIVGPAPLFMAYVTMSFVIWSVMNSLAEMTTWLPIPGGSVPFYINRFFDPSLAFAAGWNYWYAYSMLIASEISAAAVVIGYWKPPVNVAVWISILLVVVVCLNIFAVNWYGEAEFWFASIKIIALVVLIIVGIVIFFGGGPAQHHVLGFHYWNEPGAFIPYKTVGSTGRFLAFWHALVASGFAFILSPELVSIAAGESEAPRRNIPKAASRFVYRLMFFYILGSLVIGVIVSSKDPGLLNGFSDASASPFVLGIQQAGIPVLNHIINAVILTSATSAANSFLYAASRNLYSLACTGQAPAFFKICSRNGNVPYIAVLFSAALACLVYLSVSSGSAKVFAWFVNLTTISGFIAWITVMMTYIRFRKALDFRGALPQRPYKTILQPYTTWFTLVFLAILTITNGFQVFFPDVRGTPDFASSFLAAYITLPPFILLYVGHKLFWRFYTGKWLFMRKVKDIDIWTGKAQADAEEAEYPERLPRNFIERVWFWIA